MHRVGEAAGVVQVADHQAARAGAVVLELNAIEEQTIGDTASCEDNVLATGQFSGVIDLIGIRDAHFSQTGEVAFFCHVSPLGGLSDGGVIQRQGVESPIRLTGAIPGKTYACTVAPVTKLGTTPVSDPYTVSVPLELPSVPTISSTDYEDGKIILTVSVSDNGGTDITGYEATCTDGTNTFTGTSTSSPITVSGLTNDVAYTCTVTATNSVGTSTASAATNPITPEEASTGLPIWLLYQATQ